MARCYHGTGLAAPPTEEAIDSLESELTQWREETPDFFHPKIENRTQIPDGLFYDIPWVFKRQQRTIQGAFFFANMLLYRGFLLREFLQQAPDTPRSGTCSKQVKQCVDNAMGMVMLAAEFGAEDFSYNSTFWVCQFPFHQKQCTLTSLDIYAFYLLRHINSSCIPQPVSRIGWDSRH